MLDDPSSTRSLARPRTFRFARIRVRVLRGADAGLEYEVEQSAVRIGTAPDNDLVLTDSTVSRHHCLLQAGEDGHWLTDLGTKNGTTLSDHRVRAVSIDDRLTVNLGATTLELIASGDEIAEPLSDDDAFESMLGSSVGMRRIFAALPRVAASDSTVLLEGETGTGKGLLADLIHRASARKAGPFVIVDCSAIPPTLIESELFGHTKGSFTGASSSRAGAFEAAAGGTVFLDEIGELPLEMQPKLLRALEERTVKRIGCVEPTRLDVRIIAATNRELYREVERGRFRADLFYRLNVVKFRVPPLRERQEDIPPLAAHFYRQLVGDATALLPVDLLQSLLAHDWPGNVRELRSSVERAVLLQDFGSWERPETISNVGPATNELILPFRVAKERVLLSWEREYLRALVDSTGGNVSAAARRARMDRNHLRELLMKHALLSGASDQAAPLR